MTRARFELIIRAYGPDLYRFCVCLVREAHLAEDLLQTALQRAWKGRGGLADERAAKKWLFTIVRNEFLRQLDRRRLETVELHAAGDLPSERALPDETWAMRQALAALPLHFREPLVMQILGGFSVDELAQLSNSTVGATMTRLSRARAQLRALLDQEPRLVPAREGTS